MKLDEAAGEIYVELGRRVRAARLRQGVSQQAAAQRAEMDLRQWQRIEVGAVGLTVRTVVRAALAFTVQVSHAMATPVPFEACVLGRFLGLADVEEHLAKEKVEAAAWNARVGG